MSWIRTTSDALSAVPAPDHSFRNRLVISLLLVSAFVVILNETVMNVALPDLMKDPHGHQGVPVWIPITAGGREPRRTGLASVGPAARRRGLARPTSLPLGRDRGLLHRGGYSRCVRLWGALSLLLVVGAFFVRKPATEG